MTEDVSYFFFFFQAEDGIRYLYVTGVQTCALPISSGWAPWTAASAAFPATPASAFAPTRTASASFARHGVGATEPRITRACRICPPEIVRFTHASTRGQSKDSFSLSFL